MARVYPCVLLFLILFITGCPDVQDRLYFAYCVSPTGNDANPGTLERPWRTIQKAANTVQPGDSVLVQGGVYNERVTFRCSGTAAKPITFAGNARGLAVIDGASVAVEKYGSLVKIYNAHYLTLSGFEIRNSQRPCRRRFDPHYPKEARCASWRR